MLKNKLASFIAKRVLICSILLSIIDLLWIEQRWYTLAGLLLGGAFSVLKFGSYTWIFKKIVSGAASPAQKTSSARSSMLAFLANQIILFPLLLAAYFINHWLFAGMVAGILLVPFVIMVNCVTEVLKITSNNFE